MEQATMQSRTEELEQLISELRHDLRGAISPAALVADRLSLHNDPVVQRSGRTIATVVDRVLSVLEATCRAVPPRGFGQAGPVIGQGGTRK